MKQSQALKIITEALAPTFARLAFAANLYEAGDRSIFAVQAYKKRERITEALAALEGPKQLEMFLE